MDALGRRGGLDFRIKPVTAASNFCGSALTVFARSRDNLAPWIAIDRAEPGDVLVIATGESTEASVFGDVLAGMARNTPARPLVPLNNVVMTPHISAGTRDTLKRKMEAIFDNQQRFYAGEPLRNEVFLH